MSPEFRQDDSTVGIASDKRRQCNDAALMCYGTAYIFERRARRIRWRINTIAFLGIAAPASVGVIIGAFALKPNIIENVLIIAAIIGVLQLVFTIWALIAKWNDNLVYYQESKSANYRLSDDYAKLANTTSLAGDAFDMKLQVLETESQIRADLDNRHDIRDKEKKIGMRAGLWKFQRPCASCHQVPISINSGKCTGGVCGKTQRRKK